jgi:hypothetical protein
MFERMLESKRLAAIGRRPSGLSRSALNLPDRLFGYLGGAVLFFFG